jgi:hypothetical protein
MRKITYKGLPVLVLNIVHVGSESVGFGGSVERRAYNNPIHKRLNVLRAGRMVAILDESLDYVLGGPEHHGYDSNYAAVLYSANVLAGPKTLVRLFTDALAKKPVSEGVRSTYGIEPLVLTRKGQRIEFRAPCGAYGYMTVREAEKLVEGIPTLTPR